MPMAVTGVKPVGVFATPFKTDSSPSLNASTGSTWNTVGSGGFNGSYSLGSGVVDAAWTIPITSAVASNIGATTENQATLELAATWPGESGASTDAEYQFYDETTNTYLGSIEVNQAIGLERRA